MKAIIIGSSLSGKTTLVQYFRTTTNFNIREIDEEIENRNNGEWPKDDHFRFNVLTPQIIKEILSRDSILFFTNTDYFSIADLKLAKQKGFKIIQLVLDRKEMEKRNEHRMKEEGYDDFTKWFDGMLQYQIRIKNEGILDEVIDANQSTEKIANQIIKICSENY
jgi:hypothetical protein